MTILQLVALWFLCGCVCAGIWALVKAMGRAERLGESRVRKQHQLDLIWCSACGCVGGEHLPTCEYVREVRRA